MALKDVMDTEKSGAAILYSDKIIVETRNKKDEFTWYSTANLTILPIDVSDNVLGRTIINHLEQSKEVQISIEEIKQLREMYRKKAKFKSEKSTSEGAKYVSIYMNNDTIRFEPKKNKISQQTFYNMPEVISELNKKDSDFEIVGKYVKDSWAKCVLME